MEQHQVGILAAQCLVRAAGAVIAEARLGSGAVGARADLQRKLAGQQGLDLFIGIH